MSSQPLNFSPDGLRLISYCPLCESEFNSMEARVLSVSGETSLVHVRCKGCQNAMLALVLTTQAGVSSVGLVTDLTYDDVVKFREEGRVSIDDVVAVHQSLTNGKLMEIVGN